MHRTLFVPDKRELVVRGELASVLGIDEVRDS